MIHHRIGFATGNLTAAFDWKFSSTREWSINPPLELWTVAYLSLSIQRLSNRIRRRLVQLNEDPKIISELFCISQDKVVWLEKISESERSITLRFEDGICQVKTTNGSSKWPNRQCGYFFRSIDKPVVGARWKFRGFVYTYHFPHLGVIGCSNNLLSKRMQSLFYLKKQIKYTCYLVRQR